MNKTILLGRLTKDPELNFAANGGTAICRFTLAIPRAFKKEETDFINCIAFGKTGETIAKYLTKGRQLAVTGNIRTGSYDAKDGTKRYTTDVVVESFEFINGQGQNGQSQNNNESYSNDSFEDDMTPVDDGDTPF